MAMFNSSLKEEGFYRASSHPAKVRRPKFTRYSIIAKPSLNTGGGVIVYIQTDLKGDWIKYKDVSRYMAGAKEE